MAATPRAITPLPSRRPIRFLVGEDRIGEWPPRPDKVGPSRNAVVLFVLGPHGIGNRQSRAGTGGHDG
jgi:hypothetical protein